MAIPQLVSLAGVGLGAYGAYQASAAQSRAEAKAGEADAANKAALAERQASLRDILNQQRDVVARLPTGGYTPDQLAALHKQVAATTDQTGKGLSASLIQNFLGRNINPNSGALADAAGKLAGNLATNASNQDLNIETSNADLARQEEAAKAAAETAYLTGANADEGSLTGAEIGATNQALDNANKLEASKGKSYSDLANTILGATTKLGGLQEAGQGVAKGVGDVSGLAQSLVDRITGKKKKKAQSANAPLYNSDVTQDDVFGAAK